MCAFDLMLNSVQCKRKYRSSTVQKGFDNMDIGLGFLDERCDYYQPVLGQTGTKRSYSDASSESFAPLSKMAKTDFVETKPFANQVGSGCDLSMADLLNEYFLPQVQSVQEQTFHQLLADKPQEVTFTEDKKPTNVPKQATDKRTKKIVVDREKTVFHYTHIVALGLMNSPNELATATMLYKFTEYHFPSLTVGGSWKNTLRHALAEKYGFYKNKKTAHGNAFYWAFIPECRTHLIQKVHDKVNENESSMEKLMMRNIGDLPALLAGTFSIPNDDSNMDKPIPNMKKEQQASHVKKGKPLVQHQPQFHGRIPQIYWNHHHIPSTAYGPNYSIPYQPAYQPLQYQQYHNGCRFYSPPMFDSVNSAQRFMASTNDYTQYVQQYRRTEPVLRENLTNL